MFAPPVVTDQVHIHPDWPDDINWTSLDGTCRRGWSVDSKGPEKRRISCAVVCDSKVIPYARKRISSELKTVPFGARFIDTTVAMPWFECYHPNHPMTRSDSKRHKMELLKLVVDFGFVCGSETGHDAAVPYCDYMEGMLSIGPYRDPDSGRSMLKVVDKPALKTVKFQLGEQYRLPLWELVYHDCCVAMWYWGDYNNKMPSLWAKRDLFNALYGTPPTYMFTSKQWQENKERFASSYKVAEPVARLTSYREMLDHRVLTEDRSVQQTHFAGDIVVTVNFGNVPYILTDTCILEPGKVHVQQER